MALFDSDDLATMIEAIGDGLVATIGTDSFPVTFRPRGAARVTADGDMVMSQPYIVCRATDIDSLTITAGIGGDTITIGGIDYTAMSQDPDGQGLVMITLSKE